MHQRPQLSKPSSSLHLAILSAVHQRAGASHRREREQRRGETHGETSGRGRRPQPVRTDQISPRCSRSERLYIRRMKYAAIVYLRKSIPFARLQINRYRDRSLPPGLPSTFPHITAFRNRLCGDPQVSLDFFGFPRSAVVCVVMDT